MYLWLILICVLSLTSSVPHQISPRTGVTLYLDGIGYIQNYQQLQAANITETNGLWCVAAQRASGIFWILPNGAILPNSNTKAIEGLTVTLLKNNSDSIALGLFSANGNITLYGVFTCDVHDIPREGSITSKHVWIVNGPLEPIIDTQMCQLDALLIFQNIFVVLTSAKILNGAPTTASCQIHGPNIDTDTVFTKIVETRFILDRKGDSEIVFGYFVSLEVSPAELVCTISNSVSSDSFVCFIKDADLGPPVITSITNHSPSRLTTTNENPFTVEIEWNPAINRNNVLRNYVIYVQQPDNSISIHSTTNNNILLSNIFFDLILNQNIFVTAHSEPSRDNRVILLPIIGTLQTMRKVKCKPIIGQLITLTLTSTYRESIILTPSNVSIIERRVKDYITSGQLKLKRNCTAITPQIQMTFLLPNEETTRTKGSRLRTQISVERSKTNENTATRTDTGTEPDNDNTKTRTKGRTKTRTKGRQESTKTRSKGRQESTTEKTNVDVVNNSTNSETDDEDRLEEMPPEQTNKTQEQTQRNKDGTPKDKSKEKGQMKDEDKEKSKGTKKSKGKGKKKDEDKEKTKNTKKSKEKGTKKNSKGKVKHTKKVAKRSQRSTRYRKIIDITLMIYCNPCEYISEYEMSQTKSISPTRTRNTHRSLLYKREHYMTILGAIFRITLKNNRSTSQRTFYCGERQVTSIQECDCPLYCDY